MKEKNKKFYFPITIAIIIAFGYLEIISPNVFELLRALMYPITLFILLTACKKVDEYTLRHHTKLTFQNIMDKYNNSIPHEIPLVSILQPSVLRLIF